MIRLVAFLGNPGKEYALTRHNLPWMIADRLVLEGGLSRQNKFKGEITAYTSGGEKVVFLKPSTFMNRSGESVLAAMQFYKLAADELLVVHDEIELVFGQVSIRRGGGLAGHNGLRSVAQVLGTPEFHRFRLGISRPAHGSVSSWVLSRFSPDEEPLLSLFSARAGELLEECLRSDITRMEERHAKTMLVGSN